MPSDGQLTATGDERVDRTVREVVDAFEAAFPGRVSGYYVEGVRGRRGAAPDGEGDAGTLRGCLVACHAAW